MRVVFQKKITTIGVLVALNILVLFVAGLLLLEIKRAQVFNFVTETKPITLPFLSEDVKKIEVLSRAYVVYDPATRTVISGKNEKLRFSPASSTKIMTAIIALEEYNLGDVLTASGLNEVDGSTMKLKEGESMTVENLLYGLMLPSGNDAAHVIASSYLPLDRQGTGGIAGFVKRMNEKAKELNLLNTKFVDPAGFSDDNYTTAYDLARLAAYALRNPQFTAIVSTKNKTVTDVTGTIIHDLSNLNELLGVNGVSGIKTGFTQEAQGVLVSSIEHKGRTYVIVVMGSPDRFHDTRNIINQAVEKITLISY
jgi:D-alanyl-D-alanine carboxypeptidase